MTQPYGQIFDLLRQAVVTVATVAGPLLLLSMLVGVLIAIFQAATSIQEQTLTFVPKLFIIGLILVMAGAWMLEMLVDLTEAVFANMLEI